MKTMNQNEVRNFVATVIANGTEAKNYAKFARIQARQATTEEQIDTVLANGKTETTNTAVAGDWIVTNPGGEKYVVKPETFAKKYVPAPELGEGWYKPKGGVQKFITIDEAMDIEPTWGGVQNLEAGAKLNVSNMEDIYGVNEPEFSDTYALCDEAGNFLN